MPKRNASKPAARIQPPSVSPAALPLEAVVGAALIASITLVAYFPSLSGGFILDDNLYLTDNPLIKAADGLYRFWCTSQPLDYYPVSNSTLWFEWRLWGQSSMGYHITNLTLHVVESLLIWVILRRLAIPGAFLAALLFAVHPVNVESVAWVAQRKGLMAMLFFLLSILCYLEAERTSARHPGAAASPTDRWYWLSLAAFVLAMLSKGSVAPLPVLLVVVVWWIRPLTRRDLVRAAPFLLVSLVLVPVNVWFQTRVWQMQIRSAGLTERLLGAAAAVWFYLAKAILPVNLAFIYPQWHVQASQPLWWLPLLAAVTVTWVLWRYRHGWSRPVLFCWVYFCLLLVPVLGFTDVGYMQFSLVADHYQHLALIGVTVLAAAAWAVWQRRERGAARWALNAAAVAAAGALTVLTWQQSRLYMNAVTLYEATLKGNPDAWVIHNNLAPLLFRRDQPRLAIEHLERAVQLKPDYAEAHYNLAVALDKTGRPSEAIEHYQQALRLKPDDADTLYNFGKALAATGRLPEAIDQYEQTLRRNPDHVEAHLNLANALATTDRLPEAIAQYEETLRLNPNAAEAHYNLGGVLGKTGRLPEAVEQYRDAIRLRPNDAEAWANLAFAYAGLRQAADASSAAQKAIDVARAKGQTALAETVEEWWNSHRADL